MQWLNNIYKTKKLANNGVFILAMLTLLFAIGYLIPDGEFEVKDQVYTLNGYHTKHNDQALVRHFYQSIKKNEGFLVLGTSESAPIKGGNYFNYLNNDKTIPKERFSILTGAGRTCGLHIPLFKAHKDVVDSMKVLYFINPVYWRTDLSTLQLQYWKRYSNYKVAQDMEELQLRLDPFSKMTQFMEQVIREGRSNYFQKLRILQNPEEYVEGLQYLNHTKTKDYASESYVVPLDWNTIDTVFNISKSFKNKQWFKPIDNSQNYRYSELQDFIKVCNSVGIQATFIVGPYNKRFVKNYAPSAINGYEQTTEAIKHLLKENKADYIDASDLSNTIGAFSDHQHHSHYGAYLIYQKIKQHLYAK